MRCSKEKIDWPEFIHYYDWIREQMIRRIPGYGGAYPIWLWAKKPDMRKTGWGPGGQKLVRIEAEIPEERVLLSDFNLWHTPLNDGYLGISKADDDAFEAEVEKRTGRKFARITDPDFPEDLKRRVIDSWERIFPDRWGELDDPEWFGEVPGVLQACVEEVSLEEVVRAERFTLRYAEYERDSKKKRTYEESIRKARIKMGTVEG